VTLGLRVERAGVLSLLQDLGRPHGPDVGVSVSGAFDLRSAQAANRLVGNGSDAACIEVLLGGFRAVAISSLHLAVTGAHGGVSVNGDPAHDYSSSTGRAVVAHLQPGDLLAVARPREGLRAYIAVRGGFDALPVLGSRSHDTLGRLGPPPLRSEHIVAVGSAFERAPAIATQPSMEPVRRDEPLTLFVGPHTNQLAAQGDFARHVWTVDTRANRVGVRLNPSADAPPVGLPGNLASIPVFPGCIQLPPDGHPIILGPDAGTTGGYAVIGVLARPDLDRLAQTRPGEHLRFRWAAT
jgi:biotin-dependent carboxylase-like uncharacterized protein